MHPGKQHDNFHFRTNEGLYDLEASVKWIGSDILVAIWGGERPHIGAVSLAQPRPSLKNPAVTSATASVLCVVGHKEDDLAKKASKFLSAALNTRVVVTAGIHWGDLEDEGIRRVVQNSEVLVQRIAEKMKEVSPSK